MKKEQKKQMEALYVELVKLQKEVIASGLKLLVVLEGRDAAGKDGTVKRIIKHLSPRETRVVALSKPSDREQGQWYFQRFTGYLPTSGEFVLFNRSWYNRAGVEKVMGFCTDEEYQAFFRDVEGFEKLLTDAGIILLKYYLDISKKEQATRLADRRRDPLKQWKISPIDEKAQQLWGDYSSARNKMLRKTNFQKSPWFVANAEDKNNMHIALIAHLLRHVEYRGKDHGLLEQHNKLVYPASPEHLEARLYP
ncbi:polyphosphate kinase 2 [Flaviaesturariibacter aridisoli]|uniref:ADP/GDP-polyphosphate phosphotransferase n=1 Tax=Flaviaesturariibacter aridisoli TaxID=2545761 RepID=A0A4R4DWA5_9BACT|nr:polyphosphate kinase 2 [Flaviaesturariibacter aridisoli]TCZ68370.1 polyphosphate kinase 2 [Flaviaesturariibacter aridisoli]